ncbi:hypothetical protein WJX73_010329 [Symbiochloris irregularis]|uniref:20 kDa chaperonin, chloroplastic n=1 Tax=Symbiochloris irregularis TaxID=706552 RepID=A0AAW1P8F2_9CHLO
MGFESAFFKPTHLAGCPRLQQRTPAYQPSRLRAQTSDNTVKIPSPYSKVAPKGDLVLAKVAEEENKTLGGILLPTTAHRRPTSGDVVSVGDGRVGERTREFTLKAGDTIIYNKFGLGATDIEVDGELHILIKEDDVIGTLPRSGATAADVKDLKPINDRVLVKVQEEADVTAGGVLLPLTAKEKPIAGVVVRTGAGKLQEDGTRKAPKVKEGDSILYFKWAGDNMETPDGDKFVSLHESDLLCKL